MKNAGMDERRYDDIIDLPHPVSAKHPRMAARDRAAQFSPFAALTGYDAAIQETARLTDEQVELGDQARLELDVKLRIAQEHIGEQPTLTITYFQPDDRKGGGVYATCTGNLKKLDLYEQVVKLADGTTIPMSALLSVEGDLFEGIEF